MSTPIAMPMSAGAAGVVRAGGRSPLSIADTAFTLLVTGPAPLALRRDEVHPTPGGADGADRASGGWAGWIALDRVRAVLCRPDTEVAVKNRVWSALVTRSQTEGGAWTVGAVGVALPRLVRLATALATTDTSTDIGTVTAAGGPPRGQGRGHDGPGGSVTGHHSVGRHGSDGHGSGGRHGSGFGDGGREGGEGSGGGGRLVGEARAELDAEVLAGFLNALATLDPARSALFPMLIRAARRAGVDWLRRQRGIDPATLLAAGTLAPAGHPDLVLARAVTAGVITVDEAALIGTTRIELVSVRALAATMGCSREALWKRRRRAELRLAAWLRPDTDTDAGLGARIGHGRDRAAEPGGVA